MPRRPGLPTPALLLLTLPATALADGAPKKAEVYLRGKRQTCKDPALQVTRPNGNWLFVNLELMKKQVSKKERRAYKDLRFRLYHGPSRGNIYVRAWYDPLKREKHPTLEELTLTQVQQLRPFFQKPKVKRPRRTRVGKRPALLFEISGVHTATKKPHALVVAVCYRPQDRVHATFTLECGRDQVKALRKDLKKLLKKARF